MSLMIGAQGFHAAADISDTHSAGKGIAVDLTKSLYLHSAGKGYHSICNEVPCFRQESHKKQKKDLYDQNQLPPVDASGKLVFLADQLCSCNAKGKEHKRNQVVHNRAEIPVTDMLA